MSALVVLVTTAVTAPVEERQEAELTGEAEGDRSEGIDLSEEDEDDDDSTKKEAGPPRAHQSAAGASAGAKPDVSSVFDIGGAQEASAPAGQSDGRMDATADSDVEETHSNANRQELSNGRGGAEEPIGAEMSFEGGASPQEYTGEQTLTDSTDEESLTESEVISQPGERASDQSPSTTISGYAREDSSSSSFSSSQAEDWSQANGNGRQTPLLDNDGVTARLTFFSGPPTDVTENKRTATPPVLQLSTSAEDVTRPYMDGTGTATWRTDAVTMATNSVFSEPTGTPLDSSGRQESNETQKADSVTEQYRSWGQDPEGAENVELEDTC
ncbi:serine-rich adhesin for platelets-like [Syngnathoides biaculeatus]|uniref:serine-rich adhesin for platelets-like n=1 Tax=Syngnathoides biaculeatus TaxID=300417 RepID=UPI002ADDBCCB|nr:serine-rich adhesin for platelets-like [Syngnathoides biaculeatus]